MSINLDAIQKPLEAAMFHAPYKVVNGAFGKKVVQANNHPSLRPYVLADDLAPIIAEFIATAPENMTALLAYARDLEAQRDAARSVCHEREEELMELKGSCRAPSCILHRAHRGPCHVIRAALTATEGA